MLTKMMEWVSRHILLAPLMMVLLLFGCKSQKLPIVTQSEKTTITVTEREIPVFTPQIDVSAKGKVFVTPEGIPKLGEISVSSNLDPEKPKPKVKATIDEKGNLNIDVTIPEDSTHVTARDTTKNIETMNTQYVEVEKDLSWWQQTLIYIGIFVVLIGFIIFVLRLKK